MLADTLRECEDMLETVDASDFSEDISLSDAELPSRYSSGMDSTWKFCDAFGASGRMIDHGGDSLKISMQSICPLCVSHSSNFFATQGFCVHRSFEKYALQACTFDSG
jgi:hypothetical protein